MPFQRLQLRSFADDNRDQEREDLQREECRQVKRGLDLAEINLPALAQVHKRCGYFYEHVLLLPPSEQKSLLPWQPNPETLSPRQTINVD